MGIGNKKIKKKTRRFLLYNYWYNVNCPLGTRQSNKQGALRPLVPPSHAPPPPPPTRLRVLNIRTRGRALVELCIVQFSIYRFVCYPGFSSPATWSKDRDLDQASQNDVDPCESGSATLAELLTSH
jgi:hypothetical protein